MEQRRRRSNTSRGSRILTVLGEVSQRVEKCCARNMSGLATVLATVQKGMWGGKNLNAAKGLSGGSNIATLLFFNWYRNKNRYKKRMCIGGSIGAVLHVLLGLGR